MDFDNGRWRSNAGAERGRVGGKVAVALHAVAQSRVPSYAGRNQGVLGRAYSIVIRRCFDALVSEHDLAHSAAETIHCVFAVITGDANSRIRVKSATSAVGRNVDARLGHRI